MLRRTSFTFLIAALAVMLLPSGFAQAPERFELLIRNGHVIDGTGNPWIRTDIGITGDRSQAVGTLGTATARTSSMPPDWW